VKVRVEKKGATSPTDLRILSLDHERKTGGRFDHLRLTALNVIESSLSDCAFSHVRARSVSLGAGRTQSVFTDCVFDHCEFVFGAVGNARLVRCRFESCSLENLFGTELEMLDCTFPGTTIRKAVFHGSTLSVAAGAALRKNNQLERNDFSAARFIDVDFRGGVDLTRQKLPISDDLLYLPDTRVALEAVKEICATVSAANPDAPKQCRALTGVLELYCESNQRTQILQLGAWGEIGLELRRRLAS
jgi:hypothetical protein